MQYALIFFDVQLILAQMRETLPVGLPDMAPRARQPQPHLFQTLLQPLALFLKACLHGRPRYPSWG